MCWSEESFLRAVLKIPSRPCRRSAATPICYWASKILLTAEFAIIILDASLGLIFGSRLISGARLERIQNRGTITTCRRGTLRASRKGRCPGKKYFWR